MLTVITGCMFSGKSSAIIARAEMNIIAGKTVALIKPSNDTRFGDITNIRTHGGKTFPCYTIDKDKSFKEVSNLIYNKMSAKLDVLIIDEVQFFSEEILDAIKDYMTWMDVIVGGLKEDSNGNPFGEMPKLLCLADDIVHLKAVCSQCKRINSATRTHRKVKSNEQVLVGGKELYEPRCLECWL